MVVVEVLYPVIVKREGLGLAKLVGVELLDSVFVEIEVLGLLGLNPLHSFQFLLLAAAFSLIS